MEMNKCNYAGCELKGTHDLKGYFYCVGHYDRLKDRVPTKKVLGHLSYYNFDESPERDFDCCDDFKKRDRV